MASGGRRVTVRRAGVGRAGMRERRGALAGMQRSRVVAAAVAAVAEHGYDGATVAVISGRAGVSRRTFYEIFDNREQCIAAVLVDVEARALQLLAGIDFAGLSWRERVREGLWRVLCLLDGEPELARVCLVESVYAGGLVREERERILARIVAVVDQGRGEVGQADAVSALTAEATIGAILSVLQSRIAPRAPDRRGPGAVRGSLRGLFGELMALVVLPYLGATVARRERAGAPPASMPGTGEDPGASSLAGSDALVGLPVRLTYRTAMVLRAVGELGGASAGPSNREVAEYAGIRDAGQASKLLGRLERYRLLANTAGGANALGERNAWVLTAEGERLARTIGAYAKGQAA